jgi:hypothetical protein
VAQAWPGLLAAHRCFCTGWTRYPETSDFLRQHALVGLLGLVCEVADGGGHPKDIGVAWLSGIAAGEVGDTPQSVAHGVWMNEQLAGAGFDRAAELAACCGATGRAVGPLASCAVGRHLRDDDDTGSRGDRLRRAAWAWGDDDDGRG